MPNAAPNPRPPAEDAPRLLVVDDDAVQRTIIARIAIQCGYDVSRAASLPEAKQLVQEHHFDCATIDLRLGAESGETLVDELVNLSPSIAIVVISGAEQILVRAAANRGRLLGFDTYFVTKPLKLVELRNILADRYENTIARRGLRDVAATAATA